jgi:hypothetical protein
MKLVQTPFHFLDLSNGGNQPKTWEEMLCILIVLLSRRGAKFKERAVEVPLEDDTSCVNMLRIEEAEKLAREVPRSDLDRLIDQLRMDEEAEAGAP